jgi:hypothetical protein
MNASGLNQSFCSRTPNCRRQLMPQLPVELSEIFSTFVIRSAELLEEEWYPHLLTLKQNRSSPIYAHWSSSGPALSPNNDPVDRGEIEFKGPDQRFTR